MSLPTSVVPMACSRRMCRRCRDTPQVHPWKLGHDIHVMDGHGRIDTKLEKRNF
ncbi:hypothetical protein [Shewanella sp. MBTL60-112-B2]|uniref:hypothetical protein n=1 Tax=Shewanella sp. MBTL60-112-B2 TaxID=2815917 RepID=UPI001C8230A2|nr:hypothetical protein [Shewanella sp. MBTL60-112-B2]